MIPIIIKISRSLIEVASGVEGETLLILYSFMACAAR